jgi:hypothetical protein
MTSALEPCVSKILLTVLYDEVAVTGVWFETVLVLRFVDTTLVFITIFALSCVLSRFYFNLILTQAGWRNVTELTAGPTICPNQQIVMPVYF